MEKPIGTTVNRQIMDSQRDFPEATGDFSALLEELIVAAKIISREVNKAGLVDILGLSGKVNIQGEDVQKLDEFSNETIKKRMATCGYIAVMASEEEDDIIPVQKGYEGKYVITFDPLDGSSNIDVNVSIGTIFGIYKRPSGDKNREILLNDVLQLGIKQMAAGYFIYGSSTIMVYTTGAGTGVHGFTLFPSVGEFLLSHKDIKTPERGKIYSVNEGNYQYWDTKTRALIDHFKTRDAEAGGPCSSRYVGSLVADFHRNLLKGGIFMYPADKKDPKKPSGKLRLMVEANPLAMVAREAGGYASNGHGPILDIDPGALHQRTPLYIGSKKDVELAEAVISGKKKL